MTAGKKILVTGGLGFIGFHLAKRLAKEDQHNVVVLDNLARGTIDGDARDLLAQPNVRFIQADLTGSEWWQSAGKDYDEVYHFAAMIGVESVIRSPEKVLKVNALSTLSVLDWLVQGGGQRLLFSSTSEAYAWSAAIRPLPIPTPEEVPLAITEITNPRSSYAGSKIFGELAVMAYCSKYGVPVAIVRYHNIYGPRMGTQHVIPELYHRAEWIGQNPLVVYSPEHTRSFCFIDDAVTGTISALRTPEASRQTFNIGKSNEEVRIYDLAAEILRQVGRDSTIQGEPSPNDPISRRCPDISRAARCFGYAPAVCLEEGLGHTIAWYRNFYQSHR